MNNIRIKKISQEFGANVDQDVEATDEVYDDEIEQDDMSLTQTPNEDNIVIDKMNKMIIYLVKQNNFFAADLVKAALNDINNILKNERNQ